MFFNMTASDIRALPDYSTKYWELIGHWHAEKAQLDDAKTNEMYLRKLIVELTFPETVEGTTHHSFGDSGYKLSVKQPVSRKIDEAAIKACIETLRETIGDGADTVVKYKPELAITEYKKLTAEQKLLLAPAITSSFGSPSLELKVPTA